MGAERHASEGHQFLGSKCEGTSGGLKAAALVPRKQPLSSAEFSDTSDNFLSGVTVMTTVSELCENTVHRTS